MGRRLQRAEKELEELRADIGQRKKAHDEYVARLNSENSQLMQEVYSLEEEIEKRDAEIAKLKLRASLENRVAELQRNIEERDSTIAELEETPLEDVDRLKKRLDRYKLKVERRDATIDEIHQTILPEVNNLEKVVDRAVYDFHARISVSSDLEHITEHTNDLAILMDSYMHEINDDQAKLNAKINNVDQFVKVLQQEGKVYYEKIADPQNFIRQVHEKLQNRKTIIKHLRDELEAAGAKFYF